METSAMYHITTGLFSKSLFRSFTFLLSSALLVAAVYFDFLILADHGKQLDKHIAFRLGLVMVALIGFWIRSIQLHRLIYKLYRGGGATETSASFSLEVVKGVAEKLFYTGLYFTFFTSVFLLAQILAILDKQ